MTNSLDERIAALAAWGQEELRREVLEPTRRAIEAQRALCEEELAGLQLDSADLLIREDAEMTRLYLDGQLKRLDRITAGLEREMAELPALLRAHVGGRGHD